MKKINIGVLGCANIAERMVIPAIQSLPGFHLTAVASRSKEKGQAFATKFQCEAITGPDAYDVLLKRSDIDALYIPLPTGMHYEWTVKALGNGKHCLVEKPIATDWATASELVARAKRANLALSENFMFLYHSQHKFVLDKLENNEIGELRCFRSSFGIPPLPENNIRYDKDLGGGALLDVGVYTLKAAQMFMGQNLTVESVKLKNLPGHEVDIYGGALLSNNSGLCGQLSFGFDNFYQCNYELWGSKGKITALRAFTAGPGVEPKVVIEKQGDLQEHKLPPDNHFANLLQAFHNSITNKSFDTQYEAILNQARLLQDVRNHAG